MAFKIKMHGKVQFYSFILFHWDIPFLSRGSTLSSTVHYLLTSSKNFKDLCSMINHSYFVSCVMSITKNFERKRGLIFEDKGSLKTFNIVLHTLTAGGISAYPCFSDRRFASGLFFSIIPVSDPTHQTQMLFNLQPPFLPCLFAPLKSSLISSSSAANFRKQLSGPNSSKNPRRQSRKLFLQKIENRLKHKQKNLQRIRK